MPGLGILPCVSCTMCSPHTTELDRTGKLALVLNCAYVTRVARSEAGTGPGGVKSVEDLWVENQRHTAELEQQVARDNVTLLALRGEVAALLGEGRPGMVRGIVPA